MRVPFIAGNWKMHKSIAEGIAFIDAVKDQIAGTQVEVAVCAPYILLQDLVKAAQGTNIKIAAQNMHFEDTGAFTGEVSSAMLKEIGVTHVVIGHSERRQYFAETDETVNKKVIKALQESLVPIMCIGELLEEREAGIEKDIVKGQLLKGLQGVASDQLPQVVIAYEPVWAIGTGKTASAEDANDMIAFIRQTLSEAYNDEVSEEVRIQYGGSVKPSNIEEIMNMSDIDGALVGGASLKAEDFVQLVNF